MKYRGLLVRAEHVGRNAEDLLHRDAAAAFAAAEESEHDTLGTVSSRQENTVFADEARRRDNRIPDGPRMSPQELSISRIDPDDPLGRAVNVLTSAGEIHRSHR